jgi:hypothetical protein|tara:strand:- start:39852 stop:40379 length:528 start_codon:yes stop_codon:yes gene_type:complete
MSYSTVFDFSFNRDSLSQWSDYVKNTSPNTKWLQHDEAPGMFLDILMFKDLSEDIHVSLSEALAPINIDRETHSVGIETVKPSNIVELHQDFAMGWQNPFARKCNVMFNLTDTPLHIIHDKEEHNKILLKDQVLLLDVTKMHGADNRHQSESIELLSLNLRMTYSDTLEYFKTLL